MRLFRIYIPYIIYFILYKYVFKREKNKTIFNAMILDNWGRVTHLWTMPIEIRYYFLIPIIAFVSSKFYKNNLEKNWVWTHACRQHSVSSAFCQAHCV